MMFDAFFNFLGLATRIFRSGHILMVLLPGADGARRVYVGLTLSCWVSVKKPKLATCPAALSHLVCLRIVQMDWESDNVFSCNAKSSTWMIKPESVVAILAPTSITDEVDMCKVVLSNESLALLKTESPGLIQHLSSLFLF